MEDEVIALCFSCQKTFTTNEELLVHSCANIKDEKDELEDKNKINFIDKEHQKNFENEISLLDFSDNDDSTWQFYGAKYLGFFLILFPQNERKIC